MAESITIARPYAQAIFRLAKDSAALDAWSGRLARLAAIAADRDMGELIGNPKLSAGQLAELFVSLAGEGADNAELSSLLGMLAANGRLSVLAEIRDLYEESKGADEGVREALVKSAYPLDGEQLAALTRELETHFGSRLQPRVEIDGTLIGGVTVAVGDQLLDASVRGKLAAMAAALKN